MWLTRLKVALFAFSAIAALTAMEDRFAAEAPMEIRGQGGNSAFAALAGEFRATAANLLWIKVDKYHHEYAERHSDWTKDSNAMPLIRLVATLDPHFVEAYLTGGWMLATGLGKRSEAEEFLREGMRNNPKEWELHSELAVLYARHLHKLGPALIEARQAYKLAKDPFDRRKSARLCRAIERDLRR